MPYLQRTTLLRGVLYAQKATKSKAAILIADLLTQPLYLLHNLL